MFELRLFTSPHNKRDDEKRQKDGENTAWWYDDHAARLIAHGRLISHYWNKIYKTHCRWPAHLSLLKQDLQDSLQMAGSSLVTETRFTRLIADGRVISCYWNKIYKTHCRWQGHLSLLKQDLQDSLQMAESSFVIETRFTRLIADGRVISCYWNKICKTHCRWPGHLMLLKQDLQDSLQMAGSPLVTETRFTRLITDGRVISCYWNKIHKIISKNPIHRQPCF